MFPVSFCFLVQEGTELFKGQNYRQAGARYSKALTHAAKMFDLSAEEQKEVRAVQLSLYLNLAQCYLKLQSWDQVRLGKEAPDQRLVSDTAVYCPIVAVAWSNVSRNPLPRCAAVCGDHER